MAAASFPPPPRASPALASHPSDLDLVHILYSRAHSSSAMPSPLIIHDVNVYAFDPDDLTKQFPPVVSEDGVEGWYFFTELIPKNQRGTRRKRSSDSGVWHDEGKSKPVYSEAGDKIGFRNLFAFTKKGPDGKVARTGWLMFEFRLDLLHCSRVLCKVYASKKRKNPPTPPPDLIYGQAPAIGADSCTPMSLCEWEPTVAAVADEGSSEGSLGEHMGTVKAAAVADEVSLGELVGTVKAAAKGTVMRISAVVEALSTATVGGETEMADVAWTKEALDSAKATAIVERSIMAGNRTVARVKATLEAATVVVCLPPTVEAAMASARATTSAMKATNSTDFTAALDAAMEAANATVALVKAVEKEDNKVTMLMAAEAAAEAASWAALVMVRAALVQGTKRGKAAVDVLKAARLAAEAAGKTVETTARAVAAVVRTTHELNVPIKDLWH